MGNSLSHSSRSANSNSQSEKENRGGRLRFVSPENRVLPVATNCPQKLRSTDNGNILQSGGTISGRRSNHSPGSNDESEFTRFLQKKCQVYQACSENVSFQTLFGHRKSHSDPDIVRKMMEENETEEDEDARYETESNSNHRSIIALSPSKAKIKSRKKKKAPEPPQPNTLPRTVARHNSLKCEPLKENNFNVTYDVNEAPRRPLPPIPLEEIPPPPPPDYNRTFEDADIVKVSGKSFQKNRRIVDKWKFSKPNFECFAERRQRSKSLDRSEDIKLRDKELASNGKRFDRNYSLRNIANRETSHLEETDTNPTKNALNDAIIEAAKKRAERLARTRMCRNLSFKSSINQAYETHTNDIERSGTDLYPCTKDRNSYGISNAEVYKGYQNSQNNRTSESRTKDNGYRNGNVESYGTKLQDSLHTKKPDISSRDHQFTRVAPGTERRYMEERNNQSNENLGVFVEGKKNSYESRDIHKKGVSGHSDSYLVDQIDSNGKENGEFYSKDHRNPHITPDSHTKDSRIPFDNSYTVQYKNELKHSHGYNNRELCARENSKYKASYSYERSEEYDQSNPENSFGGTQQKSYSFCRLETEGQDIDNENENFRNFSRTRAIHKRSHEGKKKNSDSNPENDEKGKIPYNNMNGADLGILPILPDKKTKRNSRSQKSAIPFLLNGTTSSSSISEEEMEINLQLRPTLPRRPVDIPRFSPTDVWKSINLDFFKSHQQRSDISSEDGEDIMEEKIHRINRPVAPRRLIHDRSGDSGISPDAGSPMFLNEKFDPHISSNTALCSSPHAISNEEENTTWVPQHDLDDSEGGSDTSPENKLNVINEMMQPKFAMPNLMFPSRSLPRSDPKTGGEERDMPDKEKIRTRDRRRKSAKNNETQHFNSLRNLKRALGIKSKIQLVDVNGLDSNWSLSRSLPSFEKVNNLDDAKREKVPEVSVLDNIRRSNSESRMIHQVNDRIYTARSAQLTNPEWRRSFPGQSSEGHVMYLPEYCSSTLPYQANTKNEDVDEYNTNNGNETSDKQLDCELLPKKPKSKKKFSYQSTVRQLEKKKLEEQLAKEVEEKEKKRETEIQWMNIVEDEFRKQRVREKSDVRQRLRIYALQVNKKTKSSNIQGYTHGTNGEKYTGESTDNPQGDVQCSNTLPYNLNEDGVRVSNFINDVQNICDGQNESENFQISKDYNRNSNSFQHPTQIYDQRVGCCLQGTGPGAHSSHGKNNFITEKSSETDVLQNISRGMERESHIGLNSTQDNSKMGYPIKMSSGQKLFHENESLVNQYQRNESDIRRNINSSSESAYVIQGNVEIDITNAEQKNIQRQYIMRDNFSPLENVQGYSQNNGNANIDKQNSTDPYTFLNDSRRIRNQQVSAVSTEGHSSDPIELVNQSRNHQAYSPSPKENDTPSNKLQTNDTSYNRQQPTGMKKWLRRQNRDHHYHENMPRPEPEGGRSSSDDSKYVDGRRERINMRSKPTGANIQNNSKCSHGSGFHCVFCDTSSVPSSGFHRNGVQISSGERTRRSERAKDEAEQVHRTVANGQTENTAREKSFSRESIGEYELHTRLCRTNSGRTFESHSYYALERRKEDSAEYESSRKKNSEDVSKTNFFSSLNFEKELKENVRRKSRDFDKRSRKYQSCDYDSDESGSDRKEARYQRYNVRNQKKKPLTEHRETSFSRNHPHRNAARIKSQTSGHLVSGRPASVPKGNHAPLSQQSILCPAVD